MPSPQGARIEIFFKLANEAMEGCPENGPGIAFLRKLDGYKLDPQGIPAIYTLHSKRRPKNRLSSGVSGSPNMRSLEPCSNI